MQVTSLSRAVILAHAMLFSACAAGDAGNPQRGIGSPGSAGRSNAPAGFAGNGASSFGSTPGNVPQPQETAGMSEPAPQKATSNECPSIARTAKPELGSADVVWIIDGSGSMIDEAERLQQNLDSFQATISAAGVDTHVVLIAQNDLLPAGSPLVQSGNYLFVRANVDSNNALDVLISSYSSYASFLRPQAHVHFIVVTDDESRFMGFMTPEERAAAFRSAMDGLLKAPYTVHTVASPGKVNDPPCVPESVTQEILDCCVACLFLCFDMPPAGCEHLKDDQGAPLINPIACGFLGGASRPGVTYYTLADMTHGVAASICSKDWTNVFSALSTAVIESAPLPCVYPIPEPPPGMFFDRGKVNVRFTPTGQNASDVKPFRAVERVDACGDNTAWYYDNRDQPTQILLCPASCAAVSDMRGGEMEIVFGCDTAILL